MQDVSVTADAYQLVDSSDDEDLADGILAVSQWHTTVKMIRMYDLFIVVFMSL